MRIHFTTVPTSLGDVVVAYSERGLCCVQFLDPATSATDLLHAEFPKAAIAPDADPPAELSGVVKSLVAGRAAKTTLALDLHGTLFQQLVWQELRRIPAGETRSYVDVAQAIGRPSASRAVAKACATNRLAMIVPCHRVVRRSGDLSGYRWGIDRKRALLQAEHDVEQGTDRRQKHAKA